MTEEVLRELPVKDGFRQRGLDMTRLETFVDAAFAFALTMMVISVDKIPQSYSEMMLALKSVPTFGASFAVIISFWLAHRNWSRRYGLEDGFTTFISIMLVFILLVCIYPLRLMFSALFAWISGGWLPAEFRLQTVDELFGLFISYGLAFASLTFMMAMLYLQAYRNRKELLLDENEQIATLAVMVRFLVSAGTGLTSAIMAWLLPFYAAFAAGFLYITLPVTLPLASRAVKRKSRMKLDATKMQALTNSNEEDSAESVS